ncbi:MAG: ABC transporter substrate-binding protein [Magnetococcales bacterium]|nr:ABC transporter substrate-binding protein [Magnetococcales bacterium]
MVMCVLLIATSTLACAAEARPRRIISANVCADRLLLPLADRADIVSVSHFAADPNLSTVATETAGLRVNQGDAEEIVALHPDLVILGAIQALSTGAMLRTLGIAVYTIPPVEGIDAVRLLIRSLAARLGQTARGERLLAAMDARLLALPRPTHPVQAVVYQAGGWSAGRGTMADDLFGRLGFVNRAAAAGIVGFGALPLERLVVDAPDLIVIEETGENAPSLAGALLHHPALLRGKMRFIRIPMRLWACPDPALVEAAALMAGAVP